VPWKTTPGLVVPLLYPGDVVFSWWMMIPEINDAKVLAFQAPFSTSIEPKITNCWRPMAWSYIKLTFAAPRWRKIKIESGQALFSASTEVVGFIVLTQAAYC
jgi:hypothetical protein